jgi:hypothetical protein
MPYSISNALARQIDRLRGEELLELSYAIGIAVGTVGDIQRDAIFARWEGRTQDAPKRPSHDEQVARARAMGITVVEVANG